MPHAASNGIDIAYEIFGEGRPLLLIMGLGVQRVMWDDELCEQLASRGFQVIRFDNRDVGETTRFPDGGVPDLRRSFRRYYLGLPVDAPYTLRDMADDTAGLLDALGLSSAHIVGGSMGGMIGQELAIHHRPRVRSLTSIMSTSGSRLVPPAKGYAARALMRRPPADRAGYVDHVLEVFQILAGPGLPYDEEAMAHKAGVSFDRGVDPKAAARQYAAILASGSRVRALRRLDLPALVVHGAADPLVRPAGGRSTARALRGSTLMMIEGMGHDLPRAVWPQVIEGIEAVTAADSS